ALPSQCCRSQNGVQTLKSATLAPAARKQKCFFQLTGAMRTVVILVVLAGILLVRGLWQPLASISGKTNLFLTLSGLPTGASWLWYFRGLQLGEAARVAPVDKLSIVLVALFGVVFLGEQLTLPNWLGVILIVAGVVMIALP